MDSFLTPPHIFPNSSAQDAPSGMMAMRAHSAIPSDLTQEQALESNTVILHATLLDTNPTLQYLITTHSILLTFTQDRRDAGFIKIYFTPLSSEAACTRLNPEQPISNTISVQINETTHPNFPSLASSMSKSPTPAIPPTHSSPSNQTVDHNIRLPPIPSS